MSRMRLGIGAQVGSQGAISRQRLGQISYSGWVKGSSQLLFSPNPPPLSFWVLAGVCLLSYRKH